MSLMSPGRVQNTQHCGQLCVRGDIIGIGAAPGAGARISQLGGLRGAQHPAQPPGAAPNPGFCGPVSHTHCSDSLEAAAQWQRDGSRPEKSLGLKRSWSWMLDAGHPLPGKTLSFLSIWAQVSSRSPSLLHTLLQPAPSCCPAGLVTVTPDGSSGLRILAAPREDAGEDFSASRLPRGQLPSVLPQQPAHMGCQNGLYAGVLRCVKTTPRLQL